MHVLLKPRRRRWRLALFALTTGMLFQSTAPSCNEVGAAAISGLGTSIANQLVRNTIYEALGLGGGSSNLGGLSGLGT